MKTSKKWLTIFVLVVALILAFIVYVNDSYGAKSPNSEISVGEFTLYLDERITRIMGNYDIPGVSIAMIHEREMVWSNAYGYADVEAGREMTVDTVCRVESISKSVTAWGVMKLLEDGQIQLDEPVDQYLANWEIPKSRFSEEEITIRQLLSHSSGMPLGTIGLEYSPEDSIPSLENSLSRQAKLVREPGTAFEYSNVGFNLLELLIEEVTGAKFSDYMEEEVLEPLGMNSARFEWSEDIDPEVPTGYDLKGAPVPLYVYSEKGSGGMFAHVEDVARFVMAGMEGSKLTESRVLQSSSMEEMYTPVMDISGIYGMVAEGYGLGYFIENTPEGKKAVFHGGQGHGWMTHFHSFPEEGEAIVILTNSQRSWPLISSVLKDWSRWSLASQVGMSKILWGVVGMWVVIGLIAIGSMALLYRTGNGVYRRHRSFTILSKQAMVTRSVKLGLGLGMVFAVVWSSNQPYLFLSSIFPLAFDWLIYSIVVFSLALLLSILFPETDSREKRISTNRT